MNEQRKLQIESIVASAVEDVMAMVGAYVDQVEPVLVSSPPGFADRQEVLRAAALRLSDPGFLTQTVNLIAADRIARLPPEPAAKSPAGESVPDEAREERFDRMTYWLLELVCALRKSQGRKIDKAHASLAELGVQVVFAEPAE